jgi:hypothetical protein
MPSPFISKQLKRLNVNSIKSGWNTKMIMIVEITNPLTKFSKVLKIFEINNQIGTSKIIIIIGIRDDKSTL